MMIGNSEDSESDSSSNTDPTVIETANQTL
jgi:hypothetical protein